MNKTTLLSFFIFIFFIPGFQKYSFSQNVGIGTSTPNASAKLDISSTNSGLLPPRMTTVQRYAIVNPTPGLMIFNTTTQSLEYYTVYGWSKMKTEIPGSNRLLGGNQFEQPKCIRNISTGGYMIAGQSASSANGDISNTNHGGSDIWLVELDHYGNIENNRLLGGNGDEYANDIQQTADGGNIIVGYSTSSANGDVAGTNHGLKDYWIVKTDNPGDIEWARLLGGDDNDEAISVQQTTDGGYIVGGHSSSSANGDVTAANHGASDYWIIKLDGSGNIVWNKLLGGNVIENFYGIQQTTDGGYIITGSSTSSANGDVTGANHGRSDLWIVKLDGSGNIAWNKLLGGNWSELGSSIQQTTDGGYIIAGASGSSASGDVTATNHGVSAFGFDNFDYWVVKLNSLGNIVWNKLLGGSNSDAANSIQQTTDGGYIIAGIATSSLNGDVSYTNHGLEDYWIVKLDGTGNIVWNKLYGGNNTEYAYSIRQTQDGLFIVAGYTNSSVNGDVTASNHGSYDYWILRLDANGNIF
jgi:hypothetical protein